MEPAETHGAELATLLDQPRPGTTPVVFAGGVIALGYEEHRLAVSPDGTELFYCMSSPDRATVQILGARLENGAWTAPAVAPFSDQGANVHPAFSRDGARLYFASTRRCEAEGKTGRDADLWFVDRQGDGWSQPHHLGSGVNSGRQDCAPSVMADGSLLFESNRNDDPKDWDVCLSRMRDGALQPAERFPDPVNSRSFDGSPCISPDGRCLVFASNRPGTRGDSDLLASFLQPDGTWSEPAFLGYGVNTEATDWAPSFSPDGRDLFFSSCRAVEPIAAADRTRGEALLKAFGPPKAGAGTLYWVDAHILDALRPLTAR